MGGYIDIRTVVVRWYGVDVRAVAGVCHCDVGSLLGGTAGARRLALFAVLCLVAVAVTGVHSENATDTEDQEDSGGNAQFHEDRHAFAIESLDELGATAEALRGILAQCPEDYFVLLFTQSIDRLGRFFEHVVVQVLELALLLGELLVRFVPSRLFEVLGVLQPERQAVPEHFVDHDSEGVLVCTLCQLLFLPDFG